MRPRIHAVTLALADLDRSLAFYRDGLGLPTERLIGTEFKGGRHHARWDNRHVPSRRRAHPVALPPHRARQDATVAFTPAKVGEFSIGHAVASRAEVDEVIAQAEAAGATVTERPHDRPWGIYSGYFQDLDGHLWEILWNPAFDTVE